MFDAITNTKTVESLTLKVSQIRLYDYGLEFTSYLFYLSFVLPKIKNSFSNYLQQYSNIFFQLEKLEVHFDWLKNIFFEESPE